MPTVHLTLDESGSFRDGDLSAIGGLWSRSPITEEDAVASLEAAYEQPMPPGGFHATEWAGDRQALLERAIADWSAREWKGVLFEHVSQRTIIDNATTYVNVFAEGLSRFARVAAAGSSNA